MNAKLSEYILRGTMAAICFGYLIRQGIRHQDSSDKWIYFGGVGLTCLAILGHYRKQLILPFKKKRTE